MAHEVRFFLACPGQGRIFQKDDAGGTGGGAAVAGKETLTMGATIIYPAAYHGETTVVRPAVDKVDEHTPLEALRDASTRMEHALIQVRDVVDALNADQGRIAQQAACLNYLGESLTDRIGDLRRETEQFVAFLRG
jgi:hypothetical protein